MQLILASQSPRRRELMSLVAPQFEVAGPRLDESTVQAETPAKLALALAVAKAAQVAAQHPQQVVIGCDTVVDLDGEAIGKPVDMVHAAIMLERLSGRRHLVHTGVCVVPPGQKADGFVETTAVDFAPLPTDEIAAYVRTAEPLDKAGAYAIQGWAAKYITGVEGCFYNVMGLPVARLYHALLAQGLLG